MEIRERIIELEEEHNGLRSAAHEIGIDVAYLSRIKSGKKKNPSHGVLQKLGLTKIVTYERDNA